MSRPQCWRSDLKPENILLEPLTDNRFRGLLEVQPVIIDFNASQR